MKAVIDIGSNSVRLMLWADGKSLYKRIETTRLGEGLAKTGEISPTAAERTASAVAAFAREAASLGAETFVFATAAVREAKNGGAFCRLVEKTCGLRPDVVSGEEEALLGLFGALPKGEGGVLDIGGASTEICLRQGGKISLKKSLPVGAVRLFDLCGEDRAALEEVIGRELGGLNVFPQGKVYVIGGTGTTLASLKLGLREYRDELIRETPLTAEETAALADKLFSLSPAERKALPGMDPRRADIIAGGALLLLGLMQKLSLSAVYASDRDNLEGYLALRRII